MTSYNKTTNIHKYFTSGWNKWQKYIDRFNQKKINCLDVGANTGYITKWLLNNCCDNNHSVVFSLDIWEQTIEDLFDYNIESTTKIDYNIKLKSKHEEGILNFVNFGIISFDIIFINTNRSDNLFAITLLAWELLDLYGIIVFDNHAETIIDTKTKEIIEGFIKMFKLQLVVKYTENQYIIKKIKRKNDTKPELEEYYKVLDDVNNYKIKKISIDFTDEIKENLDIELIYTDNSVEFDDPYINNLTKQNYNIHNIIILRYIEEYKKYINSILNNEEYQILTYKYTNPDNFTEQCKYNIMAKYIEDNSNILILDTIPKKNIILYISNYSNEQNYKIDIYDVKHLSMNYSKDITQNNKKYDLLFIWRNNIKKNNKEIAFKIKLTNIILALNKQAINGTLIMFIKNSSIRSSNIYMLSKYYKCITLYNGLFQTGRYIIVICKQFIGINIIAQYV